MDISLTDIINATAAAVRVVYLIAVVIRDAENLHIELKDIAKSIATDLTIVGGLLEHLQRFAQRVTKQDETFLITNIDLLRSIITDAQNVLEEVRRDRSLFRRLFMKKNEYRRQLRDVSRQLHNSCVIIQGNLPVITRIEIPRREFPDFRRIFNKVPEKSLSFYDFSIIKNDPNSVLTIAFDEFDTTRSLCYMKLGNEQVFLSYQLRTWSALNPIQIVLEQRRRDFADRMRHRNNINVSGTYLPADSAASTQSQSQPSAPPPPVAAAAANNTRERRDFSEFFMTHDDICGMTLTQSFIYIATKCEITTVSLSKQKIIAQYGIEGDGPNTFKNISYIYIPPNDETSLYIVDRGQCAVHLYKIDASGLRFEYVRRFVVIANVNQQCNLISCAIFNRNLYVSDDVNNCLHVFPLNGERQSFVLCDNWMTPFSPGSLCAHGKYLYVANYSAESPGILVFNEQCLLVDWFRNSSLQEILAFDINPNINELYVLTTTTITENGTRRKRPLIVSMDLVLHV
jgi:hypothetical protein